MNDLEFRKKLFDEMSNEFKNTRHHDFILTFKIPEDSFASFQLAIKLYIMRSFPKGLIMNVKKMIHDDDYFIKSIEDNFNRLENVTPNGIVVPKIENYIEYNVIVKRWYNFFEEININKHINTWHVPLNVRIKLGRSNKDFEEKYNNNNKRHHPTETIHSDAWAGESSESISTMLPLFGDIKNNNVQYYVPKKNSYDKFSNDWLNSFPTYNDGLKNCIEHYEKFEDNIYELGVMALADFCTLHQTNRPSNAGTRISIDTTFHRKRPKSEEKLHDFRLEERMSPEIMNRIGYNKVMFFPMKMNEKIDSKGGFKHPTYFELKDLYSSN